MIVRSNKPSSHARSRLDAFSLFKIIPFCIHRKHPLARNGRRIRRTPRRSKPRRASSRLIGGVEIHPRLHRRHRLLLLRRMLPQLLMLRAFIFPLQPHIFHLRLTLISLRRLFLPAMMQICRPRQVLLAVRSRPSLLRPTTTRLNQRMTSKEWIQLNSLPSIQTPQIFQPTITRLNQGMTSKECIRVNSISPIQTPKFNNQFSNALFLPCISR